MSELPILKSDLNRVEAIREAFVGARIDAIRYLQTLHGGLASAPHGEVHEVELGIEFHLSTGVFLVTWEREGLTEGIAVYPVKTLVSSESVALVSADEGSGWQDCIGGVVCALHFMWQVSEHGCPESLWSLRLTLDLDRDIVIALGELNADGVPGYHPDSLVVIFDAVISRTYRHAGAIGTAWSESVNGPE